MSSPYFLLCRQNGRRNYLTSRIDSNFEQILDVVNKAPYSKEAMIIDGYHRIRYFNGFDIEHHNDIPPLSNDDGSVDYFGPYTLFVVKLDTIDRPFRQRIYTTVCSASTFKDISFQFRKADRLAPQKECYFLVDKTGRIFMGWKEADAFYTSHTTRP